MENNNTATQPPVNNLQAAPAVTPEKQNVPDQPGNKMTLWFVIGLVVIIMIVGGVYLMMSRQNTGNPSQNQPAATPSPLPTPEANLENDLNAVDLQELESEFSAIDEDLKNL